MADSLTIDRTIQHLLRELDSLGRGEVSLVLQLKGVRLDPESQSHYQEVWLTVPAHQRDVVEETLAPADDRLHLNWCNPDGLEGDLLLVISRF